MSIVRNVVIMPMQVCQFCDLTNGGVAVQNLRLVQIRLLREVSDWSIVIISTIFTDCGIGVSIVGLLES